MMIDASQFATLARKQEEDFLLECVSDWFALREVVYGEPPRLPFDTAWAIAQHVWDRVDQLPQPPRLQVEYTLIQTVLQFSERGATPNQLRRGLEAYCRSLPCHDAALILFEAICEPANPRIPA